MAVLAPIVALALAQSLPSSAQLAGTSAWESGPIESPIACVIDPRGRVFVADSLGSLVALRAVDGSVLWTTTGGSDALVEPAGIALDRGGSLLVSDARARRIRRFTAEGAAGADLATDAPLRVPGPLAVDHSTAGQGRIGIIDGADHSVHMLQEGGQSLGAIPQDVFVVDGRTCEPSALAFAQDGQLLVAAAGQDRVLRIEVPADPAGAKRTGQWGGRGPFPGLFRGPCGVADAGGWVFIADQFNHRICRQDSAGKGSIAYGQHAIRPRAGAGAVHYPRAVAVSAGVQRGEANGPLAVVCEPFERRVQAYVPGLGPEPADMRLELPNLDGVQSHFGGAAAMGGERLAMHDPESGTVVIIDMLGGQPRHVTNMSSGGSKPHETGRIDALWIDDSGRRVLVADGLLRRLALWELSPRPKEIIFEPFMARLVKTRPYERLGCGAECTVVALARAADGSVLALAEPGPRLLRIDPSLRQVEGDALPLPDTAARPCALAVAPDGRVGVLLDRPSMLCTFERTATGWASRGVVPLLEVRDARALAALPSGEWLVVDSAGDQLAWVGPTGVLRRVGTRGVADGQFWLPSAVAADAQGRAIVVDSGNHRAQRFSGDGQWEMTFSLGRTYTRARTADEVLKVKRPAQQQRPAAPQGAAPQGAAPQGAAPQGVGPQSAGPQGGVGGPR